MATSQPSITNMSFAFIVQGIGVSVLVILGLFGQVFHVFVYARRVKFYLKKIDFYIIEFQGKENIVFMIP